jgi:hypothetical protein
MCAYTHARMDAWVYVGVCIYMDIVFFCGTDDWTQDLAQYV